MPTVMRWWMALALMVALSVALTGISSAAQMPKGEKPLPVFLHQVQRSPDNVDGELRRTIGVLEGKIGGHRLPRQAIEKLAAMNAEERQLVTLLCDRIAESGNKPSADVALMLVAALIVLT
jgi:hypothetical protein